LSFPSASLGGQLSVSSEVQGAFYRRDPIGRPALDQEVRGWASLGFERAVRGDIDVSGDLIVYGSSGRETIVDGEATIAWRGAKAGITAGLLRERWGRFTDSPLDPLGPANTPFSLVHPELRLSQPTVRATAFFDRLTIDGYALVSHRPQPVPEADGRFGYGVPTTDVERRRGMGEQALAVRVSGTQPSVDWSLHVFSGLNRRPTFVPHFTADARLAAVDAVYTDIRQVGGEVETTRADWRFLAEGFARPGAIDVTGEERTYGYVAAAAEYQRLGAFDGTYNLIPRFEFMADTRGDRTDIPFASAVRAGMRIATTRLRPLQIDMLYAYDWAFRGHGVIGSVEKALAESPTVNLGGRLTTFSSGSRPSVLDIWKDDLELLGYVRIELSR
jgi:hypothetical protein